MFLSVSSPPFMTHQNSLDTCHDALHMFQILSQNTIFKQRKSNASTRFRVLHCFLFSKSFAVVLPRLPIIVHGSLVF